MLAGAGSPGRWRGGGGRVECRAPPRGRGRAVEGAACGLMVEQDQGPQAEEVKAANEELQAINEELRFDCQALRLKVRSCSWLNEASDGQSGAL